MGAQSLGCVPIERRSETETRRFYHRCCMTDRSDRGRFVPRLKAELWLRSSSCCMMMVVPLRNGGGTAWE